MLIHGRGLRASQLGGAFQHNDLLPLTSHHYPQGNPGATILSISPGIPFTSSLTHWGVEAPKAYEQTQPESVP